MECPLCEAGYKSHEARFLPLNSGYIHGPVLDMTAIVLRTLHYHLKRCLDDFEKVSKYESCKRLEIIFEIEGICAQIEKEAVYVERCGHD